MSKEELLKYLIAEIDLIMHDKDYRFENANGTWYSRESCRDLTNEEVFEELRTELRQFADLEATLAEKDKAIENWQTIYESVVQTCHNDKEEIERLNKQLAEKEKEIEELKKQVQEKDLLYKSLLAMATQLNNVYDTEGCMCGDKISGDTPEETANAYIEETKKKLREKNNG